MEAVVARDNDNKDLDKIDFHDYKAIEMEKLRQGEQCTCGSCLML